MQKMLWCFAGRGAGQKWDRIPSKGPGFQWRQKGHEKGSVAPTREWTKQTVLALLITNIAGSKKRQRAWRWDKCVVNTDSLPRHTHLSRRPLIVWQQLLEDSQPLGEILGFFCCKQHPILFLGTCFVYLNLWQGLFFAYSLVGLCLCTDWGRTPWTVFWHN